MQIRKSKNKQVATCLFYEKSCIFAENLDVMIKTGYQREQIIDRLRFDNPWWNTKSIDVYYQNMQHRLYLDKFFSYVEDLSIRRSVILMGPRRVGKTVLIFHTIQRLIEKGIDPRKIIYVSIETPIYTRISLEELFNFAREAVGDNTITGFYVFFDEIQYLKDWEIHLKSLNDSYLYCKFTASGSAAAALRLKSEESGAGRFTDFHLPPLTFYEYIHLKGLDYLIKGEQINWIGKNVELYGTTDIANLNEHFINYLNFGGYPEVIFSERIQSNPSQFIRNDIIDKVLLRDLPSLYGVMDVQELNSFFAVIAYHSGNEFSYDTLSKLSGVKKDTLRKYMEYLEAAFLIKIINKTDANAKHFQRITNFKVYLTNPSLRCALFQPMDISDDNIGDLVETSVFAQLFPRRNFDFCYANWKDGKFQGEVDIVSLNPATQKPQWATEVKWTNRYSEHVAELKSLLKFMPLNKISNAVVTTIDVWELKQLEKVNLLFLPTSVYAYNLGANTISNRCDIFNF